MLALHHRDGITHRSAELEAVLIMSGAIDPPTHAPTREKRDSGDEDDSEDDCSATEDEIDEVEFRDSIVEWSKRVEAAAIRE